MASDRLNGDLGWSPSGSRPRGQSL